MASQLLPLDDSICRRVTRKVFTDDADIGESIANLFSSHGYTTIWPPMGYKFSDNPDKVSESLVRAWLILTNIAMVTVSTESLTKTNSARETRQQAYFYAHLTDSQLILRIYLYTDQVDILSACEIVKTNWKQLRVLVTQTQTLLNLAGIVCELSARHAFPELYGQVQTAMPTSISARTTTRRKNSYRCFKTIILPELTAQQSNKLDRSNGFDKTQLGAARHWFRNYFCKIHDQHEST